MGAIKQINVDGVVYDIKATQDADGNIISSTYAKINQLNNKVDKIEGKGLSEKDFTTALYNKLNGVADNANNYVHPTTAGNKHIPAGGSSGQYLIWSSTGTAAWGNAPSSTVSQATSSTLGGIKIGYTTSGKNYAVQLDSSGKAYVNVPWTDNNTTYSAATSSTLGLVKQGAVIQDINTIDATGPEVAQAFNNLLAVLRTAGIIANE